MKLYRQEKIKNSIKDYCFLNFFLLFLQVDIVSFLDIVLI
jgi:hypothetical protein